MQFSLEECYGCAVSPGSAHEDGCDHARCPDCGDQLFFHDCDHWPDDVDGPDRPAIRHGLSPNEEDHTRVLVAHGLGQITWNPHTQRYDIHTIDEDAIDRSLATTA